MQSKLKISEFTEKLKTSTKIGHPSFKFFTPLSLLNNKSKPFFGLYDESTFSLTSNLNVTQSAFKIKGSYKLQNGKLEINYKVLPRYRYQYHFWIFCAIYGLLMMIFVDYKEANKFETQNVIIANSTFILFLGFAFFMIFRSRKKLEKKFVETFEIS